MAGTTESYVFTQFQSKMQRALDRVKAVLEVTRVPCFASDVHHQYADKYLLAERMTNTALASLINCLTVLGLTRDQITQLCEWARTNAVCLRFRAEERCQFDRNETKEVESRANQVEEVSIAGAPQATLTSKVATAMTEYFWTFSVTYNLVAIRGGQHAEDKNLLLNRTGHVELKTMTKSPPHPECRAPAADFEVNLGWLFGSVHPESLSPNFKIDRASTACHTPVRNPDLKIALEQMGNVIPWAHNIGNYCMKLLRSFQVDPKVILDLASIDDEPIFVPVVPILDEAPGAVSDTPEAQATSGRERSLVFLHDAEATAPGCVLSSGDWNRLLEEEMRTLREKCRCLEKTFPSGNGVATALEAVLAVTLMHCKSVCSKWEQSVDYIEQMLRKQLVAAIAQEVSPADFAEYLQFHNRKLFADPYAPLPFCFAVRRSINHSPEGIVSIEHEATGSGIGSDIPVPIVTHMARAGENQQMQFPLTASTSVSFAGEKYLHAWLSHKFSGHSSARLSLVSRARQFSSMIVLVGRIASATDFEPKYAAIIQNKDELKIPLDLSTIPTPKEFKDAIESLSPEQQAFAKAFRLMQLESTLFGILIIQIKPQLEKVLNLPDGCLTKEIKLTQDLMELLLEYQISSDLLSFAGNDAETRSEFVGASASERIFIVKEHVKAMKDMLELAKMEEVGSSAQPQAVDGVPLDWMGAYVEEGHIINVGADGSMDLGGADGSMDLDLGAPMFDDVVGGGISAVMDAAGDPMMDFAVDAGECLMDFAGDAGECLVDFGAVTATHAPKTASLKASPAPTHASHGLEMMGAQGKQPPHQEQIQTNVSKDSTCTAGRDYSKVPRELEHRFECLEIDNAPRPTIINPGEIWTKSTQKSLLCSPDSVTLTADDQKKQKEAALDLLDALTKSGGISIDHSSLHIVVAATHCFDKSVTETVIQDNINPIDKVERSTLIMAATVHQQPVSALIRESQIPRVTATSPMLFIPNS